MAWRRKCVWFGRAAQEISWRDFCQFKFHNIGVCAQSVAGDADSAHGSGSWVSEKKRLSIVFLKRVTKIRSRRRERTEQRAATIFSEGPRGRFREGVSANLNFIYRGVAQFGSAHGSGPWGRRFKSCHSDQISTVIMIRNGITIAVLIFYFKALTYKAFCCF